MKKPTKKEFKRMTESTIEASRHFHEKNKQAHIDADNELKEHKADIKELEDTIEMLVQLSNGNRKFAFLANYLKANIEDVKDSYMGT